MIDILLTPIALVVILVMLHSWFGLGVLKRGIIFTDLAIAQFAALGSSISLGYFHEEYFYVLTLSFALLSALLIAMASQRKIKLEAFIGLLYVLGASGIMMVLSNSSEGMEHFKSLLASDILFTAPEDVLKSAIIYAFIALALWKVYPRLEGFSKELAFFSLLALTVTSSVQLAGVLVVFVLLIAPAFVAVSLKLRKPLLSSFYFGWLFSISAIVISYYFDLPTGYTIVFSGALLSASIVLLSSGKKSSLPGSDGEHKMQEAFKTQDKAEDFYNRQMLDYLAPDMQSFLAKQEMMFIATSDAHGECDSSFRSGEAGFVMVIDEKRVVYADYKGNGVLASAGNISENPHIGLLFIDFFENKVGMHVNGKAKIINEAELISLMSKDASGKEKTIHASSNQKNVFWILVDVEEAYIHCSKNIPILQKANESVQKGKIRPVDFFNIG